MTYGEKANVRQLVGLLPTDTSKDIELDRAMAWADAYIDAHVQAVGGSVPSTTPTAIKNAAEDLSAFYHYRNTNPTTATLFFETGRELLELWIMATYKRGVGVRTGV